MTITNVDRRALTLSKQVAPQVEGVHIPAANSQPLLLTRSSTQSNSFPAAMQSTLGVCCKS